MPGVRLRDNETLDAALRRFKRACEKAGVQSELRRRERFEKPTSERKRKKAAAVKRFQKKLSRENMTRLGIKRTDKTKTSERRSRDDKR